MNDALNVNHALQMECISTYVNVRCTYGGKPIRTDIAVTIQTQSKNPIRAHYLVCSSATVDFKTLISAVSSSICLACACSKSSIQKICFLGGAGVVLRISSSFGKSLQISFTRSCIC